MKFLRYSLIVCFLFFNFWFFLGCSQSADSSKEEQKVPIKTDNQTVKIEKELKTGKIDDNLEIIRHYYSSNQDNQDKEDEQDVKDEQGEDNLLSDNKNRRIDLYKLKAGSFQVEFFNNPKEPKILKDWGDNFIKTTKNASNFILINGAYFDENYSPTGFLKVDGEIEQENKFDLDKSGVFASSDKRLILEDLQGLDFKALNDYDFVMQSYPVLIKNGQPNISEDSGKEASRTAIGKDQAGNIYIIMALYGDLSLFEFSQILDDLEIDFEEVLNLDGGTSSGVYLNYKGYKELNDSFVSVPNGVIFLTK
jgi:exopolysaccharide biosynthesis protein